MSAVVEQAPKGKELAPYERAIAASKDRFSSVSGDLVSYDKESIFAMQALMKTDYAMQTANKNPQSVRLAMINVASTGLTLNPAYGYAYLVPRAGAIVLDISYKGLIKIATDAGSILWARADTVYEGDSFTYHGPAVIPEHVADPFKKDRGELIGGYCIAKTRDGDVLVEVIARDELEKIRGKSDLYAQKKTGPWVEWFTQMVKKALIKRASKTWPYTGRSGKLFEAIELANVSEGGYTFEEDGHAPQRQDTPITPRGGVMESLDAETQERVRGISGIVREYFDAEDPTGALEYIERQQLCAEERIAVEGLLTAPMRTALKVVHKTRKDMT